MPKMKLSEVFHDLRTKFFGLKSSVFNKADQLITFVESKGLEVDDYQTQEVEENGQVIGYDVILTFGGNAIEIDAGFGPCHLSVSFAGTDDDPQNKFSFRIFKEDEENEYLDFKNVGLLLEVDQLLLEPVNNSTPPQLTYQGGVRFYNNFKLDFDGDLGFTLTEGRIKNTGIIIGLERFYIDNSPEETPDELQVPFGLGDDFEGLGFKDLVLKIARDEFYPGFPAFDLDVPYAAFSKDGIYLKLQQDFMVDEADPQSSAIVGNLIVDNWFVAIRHLDLELLKNKLELLDLQGFVQLPVLNNPIFKLILKLALPESGPKELAYEIGTIDQSPPIVLAAPGDFFKLEIQQLAFAGTYVIDGSNKDLTIKGTVGQGQLHTGIEGRELIALQNAKIEIRKTGTEESFSTKIGTIHFEHLTLSETVFLISKSNQQSAYGLSGIVYPEVLKGAAIRLDLDLLTSQNDTYTFQYLGEKFGSEDLVITEDNFELTIQKLSLTGTIEKKDKAKYHSMTGTLSGTIKFRKISDQANAVEEVALDNAEVVIEESATESTLSLKLHDLQFIREQNTALDLSEATFYSKKYKVDGKPPEAYLEVSLDIGQETLPPISAGVSEAPVVAATAHLKYSWSGAKRSLSGVLGWTNSAGQVLEDEAWDGIRMYFAPEITKLDLTYSHTWQKGGFKFSEGSLTFAISALVAVEALDGAQIALDLSLVKKLDGEEVFAYHGKKQQEGPLEISKEGVFKLTIRELFLDGEMKKQERTKYRSLKGVMSGEIQFLEGTNITLSTVQLESVQFEVKKSKAENILLVELKEFGFIADETDLALNKAVFHRKRSGNLDETYVEIEAVFDQNRFQQTIAVDGGNVQRADLHLEGKLRYSWDGVHRQLNGTFLLNNNDQQLLQHWQFLPADFRPILKNVFIHYWCDWDKGAFSIATDQLELGGQFSIAPIINKLPLSEQIILRSGDEEGFLTATLQKQAGDKVELSIRDALEFGFFIPGISTEEPVFFTDIHEIRIEQELNGVSILEINGTLDLHLSNYEVEEDETATGDNFLHAKLQVDQLPFTFGIISFNGQTKPQTYLHFGGVIGDAQNFLSLIPGGVDHFTRELLGQQAVAVESPPEVKKLIDWTEPPPEDGKELVKQIIVEKKPFGKLTVDLFTMDIPATEVMLAAGKFMVNFKGDLSADLGPFHAKVYDLGLRAWVKKNKDINTKDPKSILGLKLEVGITPLPPSKAFFEINNDTVKGAGFLDFDHEHHRYAGVLALQIKDIELTAIGLINTRLPNNQPGFSMLVSISVLFSPGIPLSFGFTLKGIGGLIGIHRSFRVEALRNKIADGGINAIMFPKHPIADVEGLISDLRTFFPPERGHTVVAPFVRIGYGKIVELDIGVLLEFPFKGRIILLGSIGLFLPEKSNALVEIHIDVLGDLNFAEQYIQVEGILRDSRIRSIALSGGFALLLTWGAKPQFLFSVGGYHPRYQKPARFPAVDRMRAVLSSGKNLNISCELYTALTSNSFQIGFRADLMAKYAGAEMVGYFSFDTLIYFRPFYFSTDIELGVDISYKGFKLAGALIKFNLSGPKPYIVTGTAEVEIAVFTLDIAFNFTWGGAQLPEQRPSVGGDELQQLLKDELTQSGNWAARLPQHFDAAEILRPLDPSEGDDILHPSGSLELRQQVVPLDRPIRKFGDSTVTGSPRYSLQIKKFGQAASILKQDLREYFSRGQFEDLSDEAKLSTPDFELMNAGLHFSNGTGFDLSDQFTSIPAYSYETVVLRSGEKGAALSRSRSTGPKPQAGKVGPIKPGKVISVPIGSQPIDIKLPPFTGIPKTEKDEPEPIARAWRTERMLLNRSRRRRAYKERSERAYRFGTEKELVFSPAEEYVITSKNNLGVMQNTQVFSTFSEAIDFLDLNGGASGWQIATSDTSPVKTRKQKEEPVLVNFTLNSEEKS
jgi:hypothetical protein